MAGFQARSVFLDQYFLDRAVDCRSISFTIFIASILPNIALLYCISDLDRDLHDLSGKMCRDNSLPLNVGTFAFRPSASSALERF
jgi:hypothetical protein